MMTGFKVPQIYWQLHQKVLTLDKVDGVSIRDHDFKRKKILI